MILLSFHQMKLPGQENSLATRNKLKINEIGLVYLA